MWIFTNKVQTGPIIKKHLDLHIKCVEYPDDDDEVWEAFGEIVNMHYINLCDLLEKPICDIKNDMSCDDITEMLSDIAYVLYCLDSNTEASIYAVKNIANVNKFEIHRAEQISYYSGEISRALIELISNPNDYLNDENLVILIKCLTLLTVEMIYFYKGSNFQTYIMPIPKDDISIKTMRESVKELIDNIR